MAPEICATCVCKTATVVTVRGTRSESELCSHPANPRGFADSDNCRRLGRYRTSDDLAKGKEVQG